MVPLINLPAEPVRRLISHSRRGIEIFFFFVVVALLLIVVVLVVIVIVITDVRSQPQLLKLRIDERGSKLFILVIERT